jgi:DNA mismatch repair ATPase MutS
MFYLDYITFIKEMESKGYVFSLPVLNGSRLCFENAYDLSLALKRDFPHEVIANDIFMPCGSMFVLSGPNQGGKTTFIRSMAINIILALNGCFTAAAHSEVPYFDNLFTHFNRTETIGKGGRLEEELSRVAHLLPKLTKNSFILFNECFVGTRRADGVRLAVKLLDKLNEIGCTGGFVTHYYEIAENRGNIVSLVAGVKSSGGKDDVRTYKITESPPGKTAYARSIAEKCGVTFELLSEVIAKHEKV